MRLRNVIFGVYVASSAVGFCLLMAIMLWEVRPRYMESMRRTMDETAHLLSLLLEARLRAHPEITVLPTGLARDGVSSVWSEELSALQKAAGRMRVYVTDGQGVVIGDSDGGKDIGCDYTRRPEMAAYFNRLGKDNLNTDLVNGELRLTAPVVIGGKTLALVGVGRRLSSVQQFILQARLRLGLEALGVAALLVLSGWWIANRITASIEKLTHYVQQAHLNPAARPPASLATEIVELGNAFESLRTELEGKAYIERYTQSFAHEIKAPLSAIRGAAELLAENPPAADQMRFLSNLQNESTRLSHIVDRLLSLAAVEARRGRIDHQRVDLSALVLGLLEATSSSLVAKDKRLLFEGARSAELIGEAFLLRQAIDNLLQNALAFSPPQGLVRLRLTETETDLELSVEDEGPGIPDYAQARIFERFYSLPRPQGGRKSTGLGLNLVKEVAELHAGKITLSTRNEGGTRALLCLPKCRRNAQPCPLA